MRDKFNHDQLMVVNKPVESYLIVSEYSPASDAH